MRQRKRIVVIGGVGITKKILEQTTQDCLEYYQADEADFFTFRAANDRQDRLGRYLRETYSAITHSAGFVALSATLNYEQKPQSVISVAGPLPSNQIKLIGKTVAKESKRNLAKITRSENKLPTSDARPIPVLFPNLRGKELRKISRFDSLHIGLRLQKELLIPFGFIYPKDDELFQLSPEQEMIAKKDGLYVKTIEGKHDDFLIRAQQTLGEAAINAFLENSIPKT